MDHRLVVRDGYDDQGFRQVVSLAVSTGQPPQFSAEDRTAVEKVIDLALLDAE
ncbi:MAG TPA: hypothetical protein VFH58_15820 [Acidimicrobiales bacterium]|nr:hypothetical protein [Acidimicrobiales bacterium]